ncbi:MAG: selenocysteine-specific translation elongation factor [Nitrospirae bacterium]|nr:selenocysteine-specific translation elongation factor [Nitrospirota bacterium]
MPNHFSSGKYYNCETSGLQGKIMRHIILGTAGHIDHGKSSLVKALTGIDPDRLKEEKERGITIDIGFADLIYPDDALTVGIVDVPGHEKLIRNMLAGAGGIDLVMLVIASDEGIMPQSREHLAICNLLKIKSGLIAITKKDLVEKDWLGLVQDEIQEFVKGTFLENAPIVAVSSKTGENLELLKKMLRDMSLAVTPKTSLGLFRLPIDRVFTLKGFGTVITGTAISGKVSVDDAIDILPGTLKTKVRGLHSHGKFINTAYAGQRVAINLQSVQKEDLRRGDVAVTPSSFYPTKILDAFLELLRDVPVLKNRSLIHFYAGTSETIARVILYGRDELKAGESGYCQFRLQAPIVAVSGDRYIIRRFSPLETLGGGEILDTSPVKRRYRDTADTLKSIHEGTIDKKISLKIKQMGRNGMVVGLLHGWINAELPAVSDALGRLKKTEEILQYEDILLHNASFTNIRNEMLEILRSFHKNNPLKSGMSKEEVRNQLKLSPRLFNFILTSLKDVSVEKDIMRMRDFKIALSVNEEEYRNKIMDSLIKSRFQPPTKEELALSLKIDQKRISDLLNILIKESQIVKVNDSIYLSADSFQDILTLLKNFFSGKQELSVAEFRDLLNTSRKFALPILEYLDSRKITLRTGDVRKFMLKS